MRSVGSILITYHCSAFTTPGDTRSRYDAVVEVLLSKCFELTKKVPIACPSRFIWCNGDVRITVDCIGGRIVQIYLFFKESYIGKWQRIKSVFKYLEKHGWEGGEK